MDDILLLLLLLLAYIAKRFIQLFALWNGVIHSVHIASTYTTIVPNGSELELVPRVIAPAALDCTVRAARSVPIISN